MMIGAGENGITLPYIIAGLLEFPIYGLALCYRKTRIPVLIIILLAHCIAVFLAIYYSSTYFP